MMDENAGRKFLVGGNWKSNGTVAFCNEFTNGVLNKLLFDPAKVEVVVAPTALHLLTVKALATNNVEVASQNLSLTANGAFTGELSAEMVAEAGVKWALAGHSERRHKYGETDKEVGQKTKNALEKGMSVIVCIGETLEEREAGQTDEVNARQLAAVAEGVEDWSRIVVAYEPVWAIGTGKTATPEIAQAAHAAIRVWLEAKVSKAVADATRILYGGSVNDKNAASLIGEPDIDGFLVGGAALKPAFHDIVAACNQQSATA